MASSHDIDSGKPTLASDSPSCLPREPVRKGGSKRSIDKTLDQSSPVRRSKRLKQEESPTVRPVDVRDGGKSTSHASRATVSKKKNQEKTTAVSLKVEVEGEIEYSTSAIVTQTEQPVQESEGKPADQKISRKGKTRKEKEAEMQPLAARATGLRMFVGAHVSAAKGESVNSSR